MNILEYYIERNQNKTWAEEFRSTSDKHSGKLFMFFNTNYRSLYAFEDTFCKFLKYNGVDRSTWDVNPNHRQEMAKQWVVRSTQSKLFMKQDNAYRLTAKGKAFNDMVKKGYSKTDKWLIIYIFILTSYFEYTPNYLSKTVMKLLSVLEGAGYGVKETIEATKSALSLTEPKPTELFKRDIFWLVSFYKDGDFLEIFRDASDNEKRELFDYVINEYISGTYSDVISYKYKPSGAYTKNTFTDDLKLIYLTYKINSEIFSSANDFYARLSEIYKDCFPDCDITAVGQFIGEHSDITEFIFNEFVDKIEEDIRNDYVYTPKITDTADIDLDEKIDGTTVLAKEKISRISAVLKRMAKERSEYKCELSELNNCKYFTGKENNKNYLEIHHLVPREFGNEFEQTIETLSNYVALCPHCHRMLHFAVDRERLPALCYLLNKRQAALAEHGINVEHDFLKTLYNIAE